jgi:hypothetical protein
MYLANVSALEELLKRTIWPGNLAGITAPAQRANGADLRYEKWIRAKNTCHVALPSFVGARLSIVAMTDRDFTSAWWGVIV